MTPQAGLTNEQVALMMAPWVFPYYYWATACGLCVLNYRVMAELLTVPPAPGRPDAAAAAAGPADARSGTNPRSGSAPGRGFS